MSDTKENILKESLRLFAQRGYEAVSVSDIAEKVGFTKGALYKHYKNKQDIFDSIIKHMEEKDTENAESYSMPEEEKAVSEEGYNNAELGDLIEYSRYQFRYWVEDEFASNFRKMLMLEQYKSEKMMSLFQQYLVSGPMDYVTDLFESMNIKNPKNSALEFYSPMYTLYSVYDGAEDKEEVFGLLDRHFETFRKRLEEN